MNVVKKRIKLTMILVMALILHFMVKYIFMKHSYFYYDVNITKISSLFS